MTFQPDLLAPTIFIKMEKATVSIHVGQETEHQQGDKNTGTLTVSDIEIVGAQVKTDGYQTTAKLVLKNATIDSTTVLGVYPRSEPIDIIDSTIKNSTVQSDSYNMGIKVENSTATNSQFRIGCCGANITLKGSSVSDSTISDYNNFYNFTIQDSQIVNTPISLSTANTVTVSNSTIKYSGTYGIRAKGLTMSSSSVIGSSGTGVQIYGGNNTISKSTIVDNSVGLKVTGATSLTVQNSNIFRNSTYNLENLTATAITANGDYWGTADPAAIAAKIYDSTDNINYGKVDTSGPLSSPDTTAPVSPPTEVVKVAENGGVRLSWAANPETDIAGYKVYYGSPTGYSFTSSADAGNVTSYTLTAAGMTTADTIAVTAYDTAADGSGDQQEGHESWFANAGDPTPEISLPTTSLSFGGVVVGQSGQKAFTVQNMGKAPLNVSNITSSNSTFTASPTSFTVGPSGSQTVTVTFSPTATGIQSGTLSITHNAAGSPSSVSVTGVGVPVAGTSVSGILSSNTTWTAAGSPYYMTGAVQVAPGVTLTIDPGVTVRYTGAYEILVKGTIIANGTSSSKITFTSLTATSSGATILKFKGTNLSNSELSHIKMEKATVSIHVGQETEHQQGDKNTGTLTVSDIEIVGAQVKTDGYQTTAKLVLKNATIDSTTVLGVYPRSEPIDIIDSTIKNSTVQSDSYNMGIKVENSTATNSQFRIGCCGANITLKGSSVSDSTISDYNNFYNFTIQDSQIVNTPISLSTANTVTVSNSTIKYSGTYGIRAKGLTMSSSSVIGSSGTGVQIYGGNNTISKSTIVDNSVGLKITAGTLTIINSTISGNTSERNGGGILHDGGTVNLTNSTIADNAAAFQGGGIWSVFPGTDITVTNTIIAENTAGYAGGNCFGFVVSLGHNLDSDGTCGLAATGDFSGANPMLGPLRDNGGPTLTHALLLSSPAIDAGDDSVAGPPLSLITDQRGEPRLQRAHVDIGAFELEASAPELLVVTTTLDTNDGTCDGNCSLREAIAAALPGDHIEIPAGIYTLTSGSQLLINKDLNLSGAAANRTFIQAAASPGVASWRILEVNGGAVTISGVTIRYGYIAGNGGGILNNGATLTLRNSTVSDNTTHTNAGGGIYNITGTTALIGSTVKGNNATNGGGIYNAGTLTLANSTVSLNVGVNGGGIWNIGALTIRSSTIGSNTASTGGGIASVAGKAELVNSIVANSLSGDCFGDVISLGHNLDSDGTCGLSGTGDISRVNPLLASLQDNGGSTKTQALLIGSPAIDAGDDGATTATDQRNVSRPQGISSDIGAFEKVVTVTKTGDTNDGLCDSDCSLRESIVVAAPGNTIDIPLGIYTLAQGTQLTIAKDLTLSGAGADSTIIQAATGFGVANSRVFNITGGHVSISGVTIRHGSGDCGGGIASDLASLTLANTIVSRNSANCGGGISTNGTLTLTNSIVRRNTAITTGGGVVINNGTLKVTNSTISENRSFLGGGIWNNFGELDLNSSSTVMDNTAFHGGGIYNEGTLTLTNTTISGNRATGDGGGIYSWSSGDLILISTTVVYNDAGTVGGGIQNLGKADLGNSLIALNTAPIGPDCSGTITSLRYNLIGDASDCDFLATPYDLVGIPAPPSGTSESSSITMQAASGVIDPMLGPLEHNGGPTFTYSLLPGSPAIDAGGNSVVGSPLFLTTDQRGQPRLQGLQVDIGAYEAAAVCGLPRERIKERWNLIGWACDQPGDLGQIAADLGVTTTVGLLRILEWNAISQSFTLSYRSDRPFNTLTGLTKWSAYWLYYEP